MSDAERGIDSLLDKGALTHFIERQRWFGGKARRLADVSIVDSIPLSTGGESSLIVIVVAFEDGGSEQYAVALRRSGGREATRIQHEHPRAIVGEREDRPPQVLFDAVFDDETCTTLFELIQKGGEISGGRGRLLAEALRSSNEAPLAATLRPIRRTALDQSNTSVIFGTQFIMKMFRRVETGPNPDVEIGRFLTERGFTRIPALAGTVDYVQRDGSRASLLMLQRFVPNQGNAWEMTLGELEQFFARIRERQDLVVREAIGVQQFGSGGISPVVADAIGAYLATAETLGRRTGELHVALGSEERDAAFAPEPYTSAELERTATAMREYGDSQLRLLERSLPGLDEMQRRLGDQVLQRRGRLLARFEALPQVTNAGSRIRCHGDYHLGQTLVADGDVILLDFEGEPARPLAERRAKSSPLRDVAGMLRSFSYAALTQLDAAVNQSPSDRDRLSAWAHTWETSVAARFVEAYLAACDGAPFLPSTRDDIDALLEAFTIDKALYELGYELNNRPDWIRIPLVGLARLANTRPMSTSSPRSSR